MSLTLWPIIAAVWFGINFAILAAAMGVHWWPMIRKSTRT
jgi:hypothetical protein